MEKYRCTICGYVYDPVEGEPEHDIYPDTPFEALPDDWTCPFCEHGKWAFAPVRTINGKL